MSQPGEPEMRFKWICPAVVCLTLAGCAAGTVVLAPEASCANTLASQSARISITRDAMFAGSGAQVEIVDGERLIGRLGSGGKLCWDRAPGDARITCTTRSPLGDSVPYLCAKFRTEEGRLHAYRLMHVNADLVRAAEGAAASPR